MNEKNEQFDEDLSLKVSPKFKADLSNLFKSQHSIPPEVDRAILDQASTKLIRGQQRRSTFRRIGTIAAAAIIIFAFTLDITKRQQPQTPYFSLNETRNIDIDQSGRVDILDAFKLARHIESADIFESSWDVNGDGLVNRGDVDSIALAAVRLNKGVL